MIVLNACLDENGKVKCATAYDDWCETCLNVDNKLKVEVKDDSTKES